MKNYIWIGITAALALTLMAGAACSGPAQPAPAPQEAAVEQPAAEEPAAEEAPAEEAAAEEAPAEEAAAEEAPAEEAEVEGKYQIPAIEEGKYNVAFVHVGPHDDGGWTQSHEIGRQYIEDNVENVHTAYVENVAEGADSEQVIRSLARKGFDVIFATSFGFMGWFICW